MKTNVDYLVNKSGIILSHICTWLIAFCLGTLIGIAIFEHIKI